MRTPLGWIAIFGLFATAAGAAGAEPLAYPSASLLQDSRSNAVLRVRCEPPVGTRMRCNLVEVRVEPGSGKPVGENDLPPFSECSSLDGIAASLLDGEPPPGIDAEAFRTRVARSSDDEKAENTALIGALRDYCAKKAGSSAALIAVLNARQRRTCVLNLSAHALDFDWNEGAARWETVSAPDTDECARVTVGAFPRPAAPSDAWSYRMETRPGPGSAAAACPAEPKTLHLYAAGLPDLHVGCDYLRFQD